MISSKPTPIDWPRVGALAILTLAIFYLCYLIVIPFVPALTWAIALAVLGYPLHRLSQWLIPSSNWSAGLTTVLVVLVIGVPLILVVTRLTMQTSQLITYVQEELSLDWREKLGRVPYVGEELAQIDVNTVQEQLQLLAQGITNHSLGFVQGIAGFLLQSLVAVFILFFCFRDREHLIGQVQQLLPMDSTAANQILKRASEAIHAMVYGTLLTSTIQGVTGGLLFWFFGLPAPILWGAVITVLGVLPIVGAFLVWIPVAIYLISQDHWGQAIGLVAWGIFMAGPMSNYVYGWAAGGLMKVHPVPALIAFIGGLAVFGISGMVLGPCILAITIALINIWRHRTADGSPVATLE
jgi:predicted PurR-regulated permease PerM